MGSGVSKPECNIPSRMLIGIDNAFAILETCAYHKLAYFIGFMVVVAIALLVGYFWTKNASPGAFQIPLLTILFPLFAIIFYATSVRQNLSDNLRNEMMEYKLAGMSKKDYINYKAADDRTNKGFVGTAMSSGVLASSSLLGPFLRADVRM